MRIRRRFSPTDPRPDRRQREREQPSLALHGRRRGVPARGSRRGAPAVRRHDASHCSRSTPAASAASTSRTSCATSIRAATTPVQAIALQYRVGSSGPFTNVRTGFVADATTGPRLAGRTTGVRARLPEGAGNRPLVQVRIIAADAIASDEWVGIDDVAVAGTSFRAPPVLSVAITARKPLARTFARGLRPLVRVDEACTVTGKARISRRWPRSSASRAWSPGARADGGRPGALDRHVHGRGPPRARPAYLGPRPADHGRAGRHGRDEQGLQEDPARALSPGPTRKRRSPRVARGHRVIEMRRWKSRPRAGFRALSRRDGFLSGAQRPLRPAVRRAGHRMGNRADGLDRPAACRLRTHAGDRPGRAGGRLGIPAPPVPDDRGGRCRHVPRDRPLGRPRLGDGVRLPDRGRPVGGRGLHRHERGRALERPDCRSREARRPRLRASPSAPARSPACSSSGSACSASRATTGSSPSWLDHSPEGGRASSSASPSAAP